MFNIDIEIYACYIDHYFHIVKLYLQYGKRDVL